MGSPIGIKQDGTPQQVSTTTNEQSAPVKKEKEAGLKDVQAEKEPEKPLSTTEKSARKAEMGFEGAARQLQLNSQISAGPVSTSPTLSKARSIAEDKKMNLETKKAELQKIMENADPKEFQELITASKDWPKKEMQIFTNAMGESEKIMKRIGTELKPEDQVDAMYRASRYGPIGAFDSKQQNTSYNKIMKNIDTWVVNADSKTIDDAFTKNKDFKQRFTDHITYPGLPDLPGLSDKAKEKIATSLTGDNKQNFITDTLPPKTTKDDMFKLSWIHNKMMQGMNPTERNATIDRLQETGQLGDFLAHVDHFDARTVIQGLTPQNAGVVAAEYHNLAKKQKDFERLAGQVDGYAENRFSKTDYEEYIRIRNTYHR